MRGFFKRILGGQDEAEQLCDVATGDWSPPPASSGTAQDWGAMIEPDERERKRLQTLGSFLTNGDKSQRPAVPNKPADESLTELAAQTLAHARRPSTGPQRPAAQAAPADLPTGPQLRVAPAPAMPVTGPQPRLPAPPALAAPAPAMPVTGPQPRVAAPTPTMPVTGPQPAPSSSSADYLQFLSPEERAIVEAQSSQPAVPAPALAKPAPAPAPPTPAPRAVVPQAVVPSTQPRFNAAPVNTCARQVGMTRPSRPRIPAIGQPAKPLRPLNQRRVAAAAPAVTAPRPALAPASAVSATPRQDWTQMLKAYGEHLTDEELLIIRSQLD